MKNKRNHLKKVREQTETRPLALRSSGYRPKPEEAGIFLVGKA
jgi:hypothetical protein